MIKEFKDFISRGNVIDLAVAVVIGAAFAGIIKAFTDGLLMPIVGIFGNQPSFDGYTLTVRSSVIRWGSFLTAVVNFLIVAFALFIVVKAVNRLQNLRRSQATAAEVTEIELLAEIRDLLQSQSRP